MFPFRAAQPKKQGHAVKSIVKTKPEKKCVQIRIKCFRGEEEPTLTENVRRVPVEQAADLVQVRVHGTFVLGYKRFNARILQLVFQKDCPPCSVRPFLAEQARQRWTTCGARFADFSKDLRSNEEICEDTLQSGR